MVYGASYDEMYIYKSEKKYPNRLIRIVCDLNYIQRNKMTTNWYKKWTSKTKLDLCLLCK